MNTPASCSEYRIGRGLSSAHLVLMKGAHIDEKGVTVHTVCTVSSVQATGPNPNPNPSPCGSLRIHMICTYAY